MLLYSLIRLSGYHWEYVHGESREYDCQQCQNRYGNDRLTCRYRTQYDVEFTDEYSERRNTYDAGELGLLQLR